MKSIEQEWAELGIFPASLEELAEAVQDANSKGISLDGISDGLRGLGKSLSDKQTMQDYLNSTAW